MEYLTLETKKDIMADFMAGVCKDGFLEWLEESGFYKAPASRNHHGAYPGALFDHSLQVTYELINLTNKLELKWQRIQSPYIVGMLHDLCKIDQYIPDMATTQNLNGDNCEVPMGYLWNKEQLLEGHGEKSCILALRWIDLTDEELMCIRYHMGAYEGEKKWDKYSTAVAKFPNVLYTHMADMAAAHIKGV